MPRNDPEEPTGSEGADDFHPDIPEPPPPPEIPELLTRPVDHPAAAPEKPRSSSGISEMGKAWGVAMDFVFSILGSLLIGHFLDRWLQTTPKITLIAMAVGFVFAFWRIVRRTLKEERDEASRKAASKRR